MGWTPAFPLTDPERLQHLTSLAQDAWQISALAVAGNWLFVSDEDGLPGLVDVRGPARPKVRYRSRRDDVL